MLEPWEDDLQQPVTLLHCLILLLHFFLSMHDGSNGLALPCHCCPCRQVSIVCVISSYSQDYLFQHFPTKRKYIFYLKKVKCHLLSCLLCTSLHAHEEETWLDLSVSLITPCWNYKKCIYNDKNMMKFFVLEDELSCEHLLRFLPLAPSLVVQTHHSTLSPFLGQAEGAP